MAITFITGVARSGKSYYSTHYIYQMYKNSLYKINWFMQWYRYYISPLAPKEYYETTYTNINEFNFDFHPRLKPLDFEKLKEKLIILHDLRVNQNKQDYEMIIAAKKLDLHNCLFIIDEGAHYFTKPVDKVLVWWLTYHGHIFHDIHILTQHMDQVPSDYTKNGEYFYMAYPPSSAIFRNRISYGLYKNGKFFKNGKLSDFSIPLVSEVFNLYVSGKLPKRKAVLKKFIPIFILLIVLLFWSVSNFLSTNNEVIQQIKKDNNITIADENDYASDTFIREDENEDEYNNEIDLSNSLLVKIICINEICTYNSNKFNIDFLLFLTSNFDIKYKHLEKISYQYSIYTYLLNQEIVDFLNKSFSNSSSKKKSSLAAKNKPIKFFGN